MTVKTLFLALISMLLTLPALASGGDSPVGISGVRCDFYDMAEGQFGEPVVGKKRIGIEMYPCADSHPDGALGKMFYYGDDGSPNSSWTSILEARSRTNTPKISWTCPGIGKPCTRINIETQAYEISDSGKHTQVVIDLPTDVQILEKNGQSSWPKTVTLAVLGNVENTEIPPTQMAVCSIER